MVSFQCDACTDVVKKPKLDRHYGACQSSFTCIDCSRTFEGPAQWKVHTSCVTEAEKYQKSMYKGPKREQGPRSSNGHQHQRNSQPQNMNMSTPGKYHRSLSNQSSWSRHQYIRNCASGTNSTPLGSPLRMSLVDSSLVVPSPSSADAVAMTERGEGKKQDYGAAVVVNHSPNGTEPNEKKRKRKHDTPKEHHGNDTTTDDATDVAPRQPQKQPSNVNDPSKKHKRSRDPSQARPPTEGIADEKSGDKKAKKKRKEKREEAQPEQAMTEPEPVAPHAATAQTAEAKRKRKKKEEEKDGVGDRDEGTGEKGKREDRKKRKKSK